MQIRDFKPMNKNTLRGFFTLELDSGLVIRECTLHEKNDRQWFSFPSRPMLDSTGQVMRDPDGRVRYANVILIEDRGRSDKLQALVLAALKPHMAGVTA